ncbi:hypothetical protein HPB47_020708 [Ixodes persulcatus]|uniref:Uncharacterized protein n=1 Tax=Ixodes persulcatus TaxID=34615 RepID=A0AC60QHX5_IXOPE|nr:hypothetical protein HPB47_020708 [Ixodes persulcatus]
MDTLFRRAPCKSAMEVQLALHPSSYKTLVSLESCKRGRVAAPTPLCQFGGVDQWSPGPDNYGEFLQTSPLPTSRLILHEGDATNLSAEPSSKAVSRSGLSYDHVRLEPLAVLAVSRYK